MKEVEAEIKEIEQGFPKTLLLVSVDTKDFNEASGYIPTRVISRKKIRIRFEEKE